MTLLEAALVLSLTGVLLAMFVPTFARHVQSSKLAEATERLASLHNHAAAYYEAAHEVAAPVETPAQVEHAAQPARRCLPQGAGPYPLEPSSEPVQVDFAADEQAAATWQALGFQQPARLRYSYEVSVAEPGCNGHRVRPAVIFRAHGDLDGDGTRSLLERASLPGVEHLTPQGPLRFVSRTE